MSIATEITRISGAKADIKSAIESRGVAVSTSAKIDTYADLIKAIGDEPDSKDINFFDYDGTLLYSYTADEFQTVSTLPPNPQHTGLIAQGWNWTLADIKMVTSSSNRPDQRYLNVGQNYTTDDGKTRLYLRFPRSSSVTTVWFNVEAQGLPSGKYMTASLDFGDGTSQSFMYNTSASISHSYSNYYPNGGNVVVKLSPQSGSPGKIILGITNKQAIIGHTSNNNVYTVTDSGECAMRNLLWKVELGENERIRYQAFQSCKSLETITIPTGSWSTNIEYPFRECYNLKFVVIPNNDKMVRINYMDQCRSLRGVSFPKYVTTIGTNAFYCAYSLKYLSFPKTITTIGTGGYYFSEMYAVSGPWDFSTATGSTELSQYSFRACQGLSKLHLPSSTTTIVGEAFRYMRSLKELIVPCTTPPTLGSANAFIDLPSDYVVKVPAASVNTYKSASNWNTIADHIVSM